MKHCLEFSAKVIPFTNTSAACYTSCFHLSTIEIVSDPDSSAESSLCDLVSTLKVSISYADESSDMNIPTAQSSAEISVMDQAREVARIVYPLDLDWTHVLLVLRHPAVYLHDSAVSSLLYVEKYMNCMDLRAVVELLFYRVPGVMQHGPL